MSGLSVVQRAPSGNGTAKRPARKPRVTSKQRGARKAMKHPRRLARLVMRGGAAGPRITS
jgi:hypothetical protein